MGNDLQKTIVIIIIIIIAIIIAIISIIIIIYANHSTGLIKSEWWVLPC